MSVLVAMACPVCFGQGASSPLVDAALAGVLVLLAVTVCVLGGFAAFIRHLIQLSRSQVVHGGPLGSAGVEGGPLGPVGQEDTP